MATNVDLKVSADSMRMHIISPALLRTKLHMLQDELDRGSKSVYLEAMEARASFREDIIKEYAATIAHYQAWHLFITKDHEEDVDEMVFPQLSES